MADLHMPRPAMTLAEYRRREAAAGGRLFPVGYQGVRLRGERPPERDELGQPVSGLAVNAPQPAGG